MLPCFRSIQLAWSWLPTSSWALRHIICLKLQRWRRQRGTTVVASGLSLSCTGPAKTHIRAPPDESRLSQLGSLCQGSDVSWGASKVVRDASDLGPFCCSLLRGVDSQKCPCMLKRRAEKRANHMLRASLTHQGFLAP